MMGWRKVSGNQGIFGSGARPASLILFFVVISALARAQFVSPYVVLQGPLTSASGLPAQNATLTLSPSQVCFVPGSAVVVKEAQCGTDTNGNVVGIGNPGVPRVSAQYVGTLPAGNYYIKFAWYDQYGIQTLPSVEVAQQLTGAGELQILPPAGTGPPQAVGMDIYIGSSPGTETFQGQTSTLTAQFTQSTPLGQSLTGVTITYGGQFAICPAAFTFTGGGGTGASGIPVCSGFPGMYAIGGITGFTPGYGYTSLPTVSTTGTPVIPPTLAAAGLTASAAPPIMNLTACRVVANDACFPTGTGYNASLLDSSGNTLFSYPEMWQFYGPGSTYNLSQGIPYYHGQVTYPIPILTIPYNHNPQSISGSLSLTGYNLYNVGAVGVGTALPAWGVDVEGAGLDADINAAGGYLVNGAAGTVGQGLCSNGTTLSQFCNFLTSATAYYQKVAVSGSAAVQEPELNLIPGTSTTITCADNPGVATNCTITASGSIAPNPGTPTISWASGAGGTLASGSNDGAGEVTVSTGTSGGGALFTLTFGGTYSHPMWCVISYSWSNTTGLPYTSVNGSLTDVVISTVGGGASGSGVLSYLCHQ